MTDTLPPLGLYIHLPWCERKCPYCDFNSHEAATLPEAAYIDALLADLEQDARLSGERPVHTVFIGGGTPSLFSGPGIARLLAGVRARLPVTQDLEVTMEANPGSAEAEKFAAFRAAGVNRLSLGIQSFDDTRLQALGRVHSADQAHAALEMVRAAGFQRFNIDLMHGLPGQDAAASRADLDTALAYRPPHLSWYQLTIEPNTVFHRRPPTLPLEDTLATIQDRGEQVLREGGLDQYEVSAWAVPGEACRHNLNYWTFGDYLGIGAGAHGKLTHPDGRIQRYAKRRQPAAYMAASPGNVTASRRWLAREELPGEYMLNALRLAGGTSLDAFTARTGLPLATIAPRLEALVAQGLLHTDGGRLRCSATGWRFLDSVVAAFF